MILGSHVIFGAYGFWLPNDPRGSWSEFVGTWDLLRFGGATKIQSTRSVAAKPHDRAIRLEAKTKLKRPSVKFTGRQALAIGRGFATYAARSGLTIWACAILPEHMHLVLARQRLDVEQIVNQLKAAATRQLIAEGIHPFGDLIDKQGRSPKCFARGLWKVFLDSEEDVQRAIGYVQKNPAKEGKKQQSWGFVTPHV